MLANSLKFYFLIANKKISVAHPKFNRCSKRKANSWICFWNQLNSVVKNKAVVMDNSKLWIFTSIKLRQSNIQSQIIHAVFHSNISIFFCLSNDIGILIETGDHLWIVTELNFYFVKLEVGTVAKKYVLRMCSVSRWRPQKVDKRMVLEYTHGLFIT